MILYIYRAITVDTPEVLSTLHLKKKKTTIVSWHVHRFLFVFLLDWVFGQIWHLVECPDLHMKPLAIVQSIWQESYWDILNINNPINRLGSTTEVPLGVFFLFFSPQFQKDVLVSNQMN